MQFFTLTKLALLPLALVQAAPPAAAAAAAGTESFIEISIRDIGQLYEGMGKAYPGAPKNAVPVLSYMMNTTAVPGPKASFAPLMVYKEMDGSSPTLLNALQNNQYIKDVIITSVQPAVQNGPGAMTTSWKLRDVNLMSVAHTLNGLGAMIEQIQLGYGRAELKVTSEGRTNTAEIKS